MTIRSSAFIPILVAGLTVVGVGQSSRVRSADPIADMLQRVSDSSYTSYVKGLEAFSTRHARQPNRDSVASWIAHQFRAMGLTDVVVDSFAYDTTRQWNVIATMAGTQLSADEIVIGGHYDSQSFIPWQAPGADDNASGTSAVLEMARVLRAGAYVPRHTLRFVAFGAEEMGLVGSEWFASRLAYELRTVSLMINFDMIGTRRADQPDRDVSVVWYDGAYDEARRDSAMLSTYTTLTPTLTTAYRTASDSWSFAKRGIKSVFHIEHDFSTVYHTPNDSSTRLDFAYATDIVRGGLAMLLASDAMAATAIAEESAPREWSLEQNYPNPFNGETVIRYQVVGSEEKESGRGYQVSGEKSEFGDPNTQYQVTNTRHISLRIYDLLGRPVAVLVNGEKPAGVYTVTWNAAGMPSGVYVARLEVAAGSRERIVDVKRMVLMK
ncbi:MAG: M28 family metallopeptidase [Bacteroidota bacterium]